MINSANGRPLKHRFFGVSLMSYRRDKCVVLRVTTKVTMSPLSLPLVQVQPLLALLRKNIRLLIPIITLSVTAQWAASNYDAYLAMGPGGLPYNLYGWLCALYRKSFSRETVSTRQYDLDASKESFLGSDEIKERRGDRPKMSWHVFPSRQLDRYAPSAMQQRLITLFNTLAANNQALVSVVPSRFERIHPALVINESLPSPHGPADRARREICHIHREKDFSLHATMSPQDCKTVIEKGWGERHPLAGSHFLPKEYVLLYAPRDEEEFEMVARCMRAAIGYMANTHAVN